MLSQDFLFLVLLILFALFLVGFLFHLLNCQGVAQFFLVLCTLAGILFVVGLIINVLIDYSGVVLC